MKKLLLSIFILSLSITSSRAEYGTPGDVMDIRAQLVSHVQGSWIVNFASIVNGSTTDYGDTQIVVFGIPDGIATGDLWRGVVYPCGTIEDSTGTVYRRYATTKELAAKLLAEDKK